MSERDPLNLRSLPERPVPDEIWQSIDQRLHGSRRRLPPRWAVAAAVALACAVLLWWGPDSTRDSTRAELERYRSASALLENRVERLGHGAIEFGAMLRAGRIEQRLGAIDRRLMKDPDDSALWQQRLSLLDELARLYAAQPALRRPSTTTESERRMTS